MTGTMTGAEALDALIAATDKAWPQIGTVVDALAEIARLRAVEKAAREYTSAMDATHCTAERLSQLWVDLHAALEVKP